jgi:hypothetical protein
MTNAVRLLALVLSAPLPIACGRKGPVVAPQLVRPEAPEALAAVSTPDGVRLTWLRPLHYTGGGRMNDLDHFDIERTVETESGKPEYENAGEVKLDDQHRFRKERRIEWIDKTAVPGTKYVYRVTAVTIDRYRSASAGPVTVQYGPPATP